MSRKSRLWTGVTLLAVLAINYALIGIPLIRRSASIERKSRAMLMSQVKSGKVFKDSEEEYLIEIFRRERAGISWKILILNCAGASLLIAIASWTAFGLIVPRRK